MNTSVRWMLVVTTGAVVWAVSAGLNHAQSANEPAHGTRVAVVDLVQLFNDFDQTEVLNDKMKEYRLRLNEEADARMQKIQNEKKLLDAFNPNTPEFFSKWKEYRKMMFDYRAWELTTQDLLSEDHRRWIVTTYQTVTEEIAQVAKRHGYDIVITKEQIDLDVPETKALLTQLISRKAVYASPEVDLTEEVLTNLNAEFERKGGARSIEFSRFGE